MLKQFPLKTSGMIDHWLDTGLPKGTARQWLHAADLDTPGKQLTIRALGAFSRSNINKDSTVLDWPFPKATIALLRGDMFTDGSGNGEQAVRGLAILPDAKSTDLTGDMGEEIESEWMSFGPLFIADLTSLREHWQDGGPLSQTVLGDPSVSREVIEQIRKTVALVQDLGHKLDVTGGARGHGISAEFIAPLTDREINQINKAIDAAGLDAGMHARVVKSHDAVTTEQSIVAGVLAPTLGHGGKAYGVAFDIAFTCDDQTIRGIYRNGKLVGYLWVLYDEDLVDGEDTSPRCTTDENQDAPLTPTLDDWFAAGKAASVTMTASLSSGVNRAIEADKDVDELDYDPERLKWVRLDAMPISGHRLAVVDAGFCTREHRQSEAVVLDWSYDSAVVYVGLGAFDDSGRAFKSDDAVAVAAFAALPSTRAKLKGPAQLAGDVAIETHAGLVADWQRLCKQWRDGGAFNESVLHHFTNNKKDIPALKAAAKVVTDAGFELDVEEKPTRMQVRFPDPLSQSKINRINAALRKAGRSETVNVIMSHSESLLRQQLDAGKAVAELTDTNGAYARAFAIRDFGIFSFKQGGDLTGYLFVAREL